MITAEFESLFRSHFRSAVFIAEMIVCSAEAAEDIVQDVFIKMLDCDMAKIKSPARFLYMSVRNAAVDYCRSHVIRVRESVRTTDIPDDTNYDLDSEEIEYANNLRKLFNAIEELPARSRDVVRLICLENYSYSDAADKLGMSLSTVKTHMYRSFKTLRKYFALLL